MAEPIESFFNVRRSGRVSPTKAIGRPGTQIYGGYVVDNELNRALSDRDRFRSFSNILANCSIVGAGVRYFLNLVGGSKWSFEPSEADRDGKFADLAEQIMVDDPTTSFPRIVRRGAMYRFYGFSLQEWIMRRRADGVMTFADVAPRPQITIEQWDVDVEGNVLGVVQRNPQDSREIYLPRQKLVYLVDDSMNDSPQGFGLFRNIYQPAKTLERYEQLEGFGFETDLRGVPVGKVPYAALRKAVEDGVIEPEDAKKAVAAIESFVEKHVKNPELGLLIDSAVYETQDAEATPSSVPQFSIELLKGSSTSQPEMAKAIERKNREIARIIGVEAILLGDGDRGSHALSKDKTNQFALIIESTLDEIADQFKRDLLEPIWQTNGWPEEMMPTPKPEGVSHVAIEEATSALRDLADAGAPLTPDDPAIPEIRSRIGVPAQDPAQIAAQVAMRDAGLRGLQAAADDRSGASDLPRPDDPDNDIPDNPNDSGR